VSKQQGMVLLKPLRRT